MKKLELLLSSALVFALLFSGCKKDGETGPAGPAGANGTNGNANVKLVYFGPDTLNTTTTWITHNFDSTITENMIDSSLVLIYHENSGFWYPSPGLGLGGSYQTRAYTYGTPSVASLTLQIYNTDGSTYTGGQQIFSRIKVIIAPADIFTGRGMKVDTRDYYSTMGYLGLDVD